MQLCGALRPGLLQPLQGGAQEVLPPTHILDRTTGKKKIKLQVLPLCKKIGLKILYTVYTLGLGGPFNFFPQLFYVTSYLNCRKKS